MKNLLFLFVFLNLFLASEAQKTVTTKTVTTVRDKSGKVEKADSSVITTTIVPEKEIVRDTVYLTSNPPVVNPPVTPPATGTPYGGRLVYSNGYDKTSDVTNASGQLGQGSVSYSTFKTGPGSFKSLVNTDPKSNVSSGMRSEVQYPSTYSKDKDNIVVEYDVMYEKPFSSDGLTTQWHGTASNTSGQLSLWIQGGKFMVMRQVDNKKNLYQCDRDQPCAPGGKLMAVQPGKWYNMRWHVRFSSGTDGYVRLYIDNVLYYSANGRTSDGGGQYLKIGTNRWNVSTESVIYFDNLKIWNGTDKPNPSPVPAVEVNSGTMEVGYFKRITSGQQSVKRKFTWHGLDTTNPKPVLPPVPTDTTLLLSRADINQLFLLLGDKIQMPDGSVLMISGNERDRISYLFEQAVLIPAVKRWQKQNTKNK